MVKVDAFCGHYIPTGKWIWTDWGPEPPECEWEDVIELDDDEWEEGCASHICPVCGAELYQDGDHFEPVINSNLKKQEVKRLI